MTVLLIVVPANIPRDGATGCAAGPVGRSCPEGFVGVAMDCRDRRSTHQTALRRLGNPSADAPKGPIRSVIGRRPRFLERRPPE